MPEISTKGRHMPESPIRKLVPFAEEALAKGRKIYHLNIGQPDIKTPVNMIEAVKNCSSDVIEYTHSAGLIEYREKLAAYYHKQNLDVDVEDILVTTGASEALYVTLLSCLEIGDEVIVPEPFYANYFGFSVVADVNIVPVVSKIENGFALPPISAFEELITTKTKAILICNPNNPTGYLYSREEMEQLKELVKKYNLFLISDEVYREFCYEGEHISALELKGIEENTIMVDSLSKRYSACGVRIGNIVTKNRNVYNAVLKFAQSRLSPPYYGQIAGISIMDTPDKYFEDVNKEYKYRRDYTIKRLTEMPGVVTTNPKGAFYCIARLPVDDAEKFCKWMLKDYHYDNQTLMLAPASGFYSNPRKGFDEVRIAYVLNRCDLKNAFDVLENALIQYPGKTS